MVTQTNNRILQTAVSTRKEANWKEGGREAAKPVPVTPLEAAETILRRFGARAISILSNPRTLEDGRTLPARLSANDCYVAMEEACRKMARVALRKFEGDTDAGSDWLCGRAGSDLSRPARVPDALHPLRCQRQ